MSCYLSCSLRYITVGILRNISYCPRCVLDIREKDYESVEEVYCKAMACKYTVERMTCQRVNLSIFADLICWVCLRYLVLSIGMLCLHYRAIYGQMLMLVWSHLWTDVKINCGTALMQFCFLLLEHYVWNKDNDYCITEPLKWCCNNYLNI